MKANEEEIQDNYYQHEYYKDADRVINIAATEDNDIPYIMVYETVYYGQEDKTQQSIIFLYESTSSVQLYSNIGSDEMDGSVKVPFEPATFKENTTLTQYYDLKETRKMLPMQWLSIGIPIMQHCWMHWQIICLLRIAG